MRVDHHINARGSAILRIVYHRALHAAECTSNIGDHHMADDELCGRVRWINFVSRFHVVLFLSLPENEIIS